MDKPLCLTPEQYWKWRLTIEEMETAKLKYDNAVLRHKLLAKDAELVSARARIVALTEVESMQGKIGQAKDEYDKMKASIEEELGISLSGKMIDDGTFEIRDLPTTT